MASNGGFHLPAFEEIIKRGSASEPKNNRPVPKVRNNNLTGDLSLNSAVKAANNKRNTYYDALSASEPRKRSNKKKKTTALDESEFSSEGSPSQARRRTPMTMPRTKVTAATPLEQKIALKKLKQKLTFEKQEGKMNCDDIEQINPSLLNGFASLDEVSVSSVSEHPGSELSEFDDNKIKSRLNQVQEYLKQATSMYVSLSMDESTEPKRTDQMNKLAKLIQQLRVQEQGYLDLLEKSMNMDDTHSNAETFSVLSADQQSVQSASIEQNLQSDVKSQQQELERLREQQSLLKKIVQQQKELKELKEKQTSLLKMQENAENMMKEKHLLNYVPNNQREGQPEERKPINSTRQSQMTDRDAAISTNDTAEESDAVKRAQLVSKLQALQEKKEQMDELMVTLKALKNAQTAEENMVAQLNQDTTKEAASEMQSVDNDINDEDDEDNMDVGEKIDRLNDVRERLHELRSIVAEYESGNIQSSAHTTDASRDNRLHAQAIRQKQGNTITGKGGARVRIPNQDFLLNDLQNLQNGIEELMDNRCRPAPSVQQKIDVTRNPPLKIKTKNTNREKKQQRTNKNTSNELSADYTNKMRELQLARNRIVDENSYLSSDKDSASIRSATTQTEDSESGKDSDVESEASSMLQWQDDPEFQTKVKKLQMAREKLHQLQQLVKVVQEGGAQLPIDDLIDLTLSISDEENETSACGESEEEDAGEDEEETGEEEQSDDEDADGEQTENDNQEGESVASKSTDINYNFAPENGLSDNERRYQGLLRKQRLELNYLLKERERLLEAQQKLSSLATSAVSAHTQTNTTSVASLKNVNTTSGSQKTFPTLTQAELNKQDRYKERPRKSLFAKLDGMSVEPHYGSEHEIFPPSVKSDKESMTGPLANAMAVSEIRRQRDLFEQKKRQKFVEKQQRKRKNRSDENQSDDRATYSVHSDIDEGVGVSMYSADVTTAATWGGSTEQSSSEEDSAVGEEFPDNNNAEDGDEYGSQFDQPEEEEEEADASNVPPVFKAKKYGNEQPRRGISWLNETTPSKKSSADLYRNNGGSVSWSLDVSPPRSRRRLRQGNLTPAHKLIHDNKRKRQRSAQFEGDVTDASATVSRPDEQLQSQLASMCTSLLRNEQTLLSMLQNQSSAGYEARPTSQQESRFSNSQTLHEIRQFFERSTLNQSYQQTLDALKTCYDRVEQHQLDMEYLKRQFESLNQPSYPAATDYRSPWPNPPSLHLSSFGGVNNEIKPDESKHEFATSIPSCLKSMSGFPKSTQTETTLFEDPFKPSIQPYTLFGETSLDAGLSPNRKEQDDFTFEPVPDPVSPGTIGERIFQQFEDNANEEEPSIPFRLRMSEYNPLSYQGGNFADTATGNVVTVSKLSLNKDRAETMVSEHKADQNEKSIWPSFFKLAEASIAAENVSENSSKYTSSLAGRSASNELPNKTTSVAAKADDEMGARSTESNFSLFEALRDSIYSEVATLIAMNESRPHYLVELFRELQLLNSDYLRQRALYSLQELVTRFLTDDSTTSSPTKPAFKQETIPSTTTHAPYEQWVASASEQTPSESVLTTDDESESQALQTLARQIQNNDMYDYAELADTQSDTNVSTPASTCDIPFAAEDLGNTVINLEEALEKMKLYEQNMAKVKKAFEQDSPSPSTAASSINDRQNTVNAAYEAVKRRVNAQLDTTSNSSAADVTSQASSDMPQPSVDTKKLDRQIKSVMMDLIPFLNDHIESICDEELLGEIRRSIVQFSKGKEQFDESFHRQLDSILKDSLMKFHSRKLKECGEDILIDVSEILFNELAFFRLMQDLNRPLYEGLSAEDFKAMNNDIGQHFQMAPISSPGDDESSVAESVDTVENETPQTSSQSSSLSNAYVVIDPLVITDEETESSRQFVNVELSVSESRPVRSSGSGEDDNEEEPSLFSKASTPASSINLYSQVIQANAANNEQGGVSGGPQPEGLNNHSSEQVSQSAAGNVPVENEQDCAAEDERDEGDQLAEEDERIEHERGEAVADELEDQGGVESESAEDERNLEQGTEAPEGEDNLEQDRVESLNQQNETEEVAEDDLPEADMASEENIAAAQVVLDHLEGQQELAGDPQALPQVTESPP